MGKIRITDLARELQIKSVYILDCLPKIGVTEKKTHTSSLEDFEASRLRTWLRNLSPKQRAEIDEEIRRRREDLRISAQEATTFPRGGPAGNLGLQAPAAVLPRVQSVERPCAQVPVVPHEMHKAPPPPTSAKPVVVVSEEDWARDLASARRLIMRLLDEIEGTKGSPKEKLSKRINDLSFQRKIPRYVRALMVVIVEYRNEVEYNDYMPTEAESVTIDAVWRALTEWAVNKGFRTSSKMGGWPTHVSSK